MRPHGHRPISTFAFAFAVAAVFAASSLRAQEDNRPPPGFRALFNGRNLDGWTVTIFGGDPRKVLAASLAERAKLREAARAELERYWRVEQGEIVNREGKGPYIETAEDCDFELHAKLRIEGDGARGAFGLRVAAPGEAGGYEVSVSREDGVALACKTGEEAHRWPPRGAGKATVRQGEASHLYAIARGDSLRAWLDGVTAAEAFYPPGRARGALSLAVAAMDGGQAAIEVEDLWIREIAAELHLEHEPPRDEDGFTALFNGKDLCGWIGGVAGYRVEDGKLVCQRQGGGNLYAEKKFSDFVLRFDFKLEPGANNGVGIRADYDPVNAPDKYPDAAYHGMEIQILDSAHPSYAEAHDYQFHGSIYDLVPALRGYQKPIGCWNHEEITAQGNRVTVKLNGVTIVDADLEKDTPREKWARHPGLFNKSGYIGFLGHGHRIEFRNIRIREL